jgi:hypothetical protein
MGGLRGEATHNTTRFNEPSACKRTGESDLSVRAHSNNENDCLFLGEIGFRFG